MATTVALLVVRGPVALAKALMAIDLLSDGRCLAGVGPGSSERDYAAAGVPFAERWARFDDALVARALRRRPLSALHGARSPRPQDRWVPQRARHDVDVGDRRPPSATGCSVTSSRRC
jgi:alkanesulfonate monooxygenase SsuD/methylene tetrahydromethanopterin reductase-like flavin-dependent oxidoreductase (luciferase family)